MYGTFECNDQLSQVLKTHGFIETSTDRDKLKGKKEFRLTPHSSIKLHFDYMNFKLIEGLRISSQFGESAVKAEDLRLLFWYLKSSYSDRVEICGTKFNIDDARNALLSINNELNFYLENDLPSRKLNKLKRLSNSYNSIIFN